MLFYYFIIPRKVKEENDRCCQHYYCTGNQSSFPSAFPCRLCYIFLFVFFSALFSKMYYNKIKPSANSLGFKIICCSAFLNILITKDGH